MRRFLAYGCAVLACVMVASLSAQAQDEGSAETFLQSVYARYSRNGPGLEIAGPHADRYLHSSLIALIREDARAVEGVGVLDGDPICGCQDWDGIRIENTCSRV
jgi:hypothetical protein